METMLTRDKIGEGRAAAESIKRGIKKAIEQWQEAPDKEKGDRALNVLSHIGSLPGMKLTDFVDEETARKIKADFESSNG